MFVSWWQRFQDYDPGGPTLSDIDNAVKSPETWAWLSAVNSISYESEWLGRWGEGCLAAVRSHKMM
jgi:hypothetical protein